MERVALLAHTTERRRLELSPLGVSRLEGGRERDAGWNDGYELRWVGFVLRVESRDFRNPLWLD